MKVGCRNPSARCLRCARRSRLKRPSPVAMPCDGRLRPWRERAASDGEWLSGIDVGSDATPRLPIPADMLAGGRDERGPRVAADGGGTGGEPQQRHAPPRTVEIAFGLRKEDRQVMRDERVVEADLAQRHLMIRVRDLLQVQHTDDRWIEKPLGATGLQ